MKSQPLYNNSIHCHLQTVDLGAAAIELFVPDEAGMKEAYNRGGIPFPYWSKLWPAAIALSKFLLHHPELITAKKVVELGAGLGLPSIIAAQRAASVLCTDYVAEAMMIVQQSAAQNGCSHLRTAVIDWNHLPPQLEAEVLLLSDVNYNPAFFAVLTEVTARFLKKGTTVILSTPQRLMARDFVAHLLPFCKQQEEISVKQNETDMPVSVLVL